jgi:hypothetical protein
LTWTFARSYFQEPERFLQRYADFDVVKAATAMEPGGALEMRAQLLGLSATDSYTNSLHAFSATAPNQRPPCVHDFVLGLLALTVLLE